MGIKSDQYGTRYLRNLRPDKCRGTHPLPVRAGNINSQAQPGGAFSYIFRRKEWRCAVHHSTDLPVRRSYCRRPRIWRFGIPSQRTRFLVTVGVSLTGNHAIIVTAFTEQFLRSDNRRNRNSLNDDRRYPGQGNDNMVFRLYPTLKRPQSQRMMNATRSNHTVRSLPARAIPIRSCG